ncbi:MAG: nitroreductase family protein [Nitrososphaerales archaeon]
MEALECIFTKREIREFKAKEVPEHIIFKILEAGRLAGSAKNRQPWDFILIKDKRRLYELSNFGRYAQHMREAYFAIVIVRSNDYVHDPFDAGRAAQNMMLAAHALGVGSCPITLHDEEKAKKYLGVPEEKRIQVCLDFGYPLAIKRKGKVIRKPLEQILHSEKW